MERLTPEFFEQDPVICARELIGARFVWSGCEGRIVETEAYTAEGDPACHTFFRPSSRAFVDAHAAGTAYVYLNYGVHWLFNILVKGPDGAGFVLFRALEPIAGIDLMVVRRGKWSPCDLCSGPGKLTQALGIDGSAHGLGFLGDEGRGLFAGEPVSVAAGPRIGISRAINLPWRFCHAGNRFVSR